MQHVLGWKWVGPYNLLDLFSTLLLITTAADYLIHHDEDWLKGLAQTTGSIGVGLKCLGLLGYLDSFQCAHHCLAVVVLPY